MLKHPGVMVAAIICGTILGLGLIGVLGLLLWAGKDTAALLTLVNALVSAMIYAKVRNVDARATRIEAQTNGATTRLMDHALGPRPTVKDE